jgi:hypothetical protein
MASTCNNQVYAFLFRAFAHCNPVIFSSILSVSSSALTRTTVFKLKVQSFWSIIKLISI